jgi:hypothetical protein
MSIRIFKNTNGNENDDQIDGENHGRTQTSGENNRRQVVVASFSRRCETRRESQAA